ncbi:MAG: 50S ribosomal protein L11 methyltransferase [Bdellovibrionales bacterium]|nr:50S ribosomal protein L11 methyltransferase [Bdellovibrionales bacterium]
MDYFFVLTLEQVPRSREEELTSELMELGAQGFSEKLDFAQDFDAYTVDFLPRDPFAVEIYFSDDSNKEAIEATLKSLEIEGPIWEKRANQDWQENWKKGWDAFPLVDDFWVVPSWKEIPPEAKQPIMIDPGLAFGTGTHETTQIAARMISNVLKGGRESIPKLRSIPIYNAIDVGTGTGILAIQMRMLGLKNIVATEIDELAAEAARENLERNKCGDILVHCSDLDQVEGKFDFVVANIIDGVLTRLQDHFDRLLAPNGIALMTGILNEREQLYLDRMVWRRSLVELARIQKGDWVGYLYQRPEEK